MEFSDTLTALQGAIRRSKAVNVNTKALRDDAKAVVQQYFRAARPDLRAIGISDDGLASLDAEAQTLLGLANGPNAKKSYISTLLRMRNAAATVEVERELRLGEQRVVSRTAPNAIEGAILRTLTDLAPSAAAPYQQALIDLSQADRVSYRGPAHELREALREALDRLAPDSDVEQAEWYSLEKDRTKPTQRQKMRYILTSRGLSARARKTPEDTVGLVDELTASVARGSYERTSVAAHVGFSKPEVLQLKMYVDTILAEILEIHRATP